MEGFAQRGEDHVRIQGYDGARVDDLALDPFPRQLFRGMQRFVNHERCGDYGNVPSLPHHLSHAQGNEVVVLGHFPATGQQPAMLEEEHRVVVAYGALPGAVRSSSCDRV